MKRTAIILIVLGLVACSPDDTANRTDGQTSVPATADQISYAETANPTDPVLAEIYQRSCASCHSFVDAGGPLTGHEAAWSALLAAKGVDGLLASVKSGLGAMPAMGLCADCTDEQFLELIEFMAHRQE